MAGDGERDEGDGRRPPCSWPPRILPAGCPHQRSSCANREAGPDRHGNHANASAMNSQRSVQSRNALEVVGVQLHGYVVMTAPAKRC